MTRSAKSKRTTNNTITQTTKASSGVTEKTKTTKQGTKAGKGHREAKGIKAGRGATPTSAKASKRSVLPKSVAYSVRSSALSAATTGAAPKSKAKPPPKAKPKSRLSGRSKGSGKSKVTGVTAKGVAKSKKQSPPVSNKKNKNKKRHSSASKKLTDAAGNGGSAPELNPKSEPKMSVPGTAVQIQTCQAPNGSVQNEGDGQASHLKGSYRKMLENRFSQQRIPACTPLLTVSSAIPYFALITIGFAIIGGLCYFSDVWVELREIDYTDCMDYRTGKACSKHLEDILAAEIAAARNATNSTRRTTTSKPSVPFSSSTNTTPKDPWPGPSSSINVSTLPDPCICHMEVKIERTIPQPAFMYYSIEHMYQSYLPYSESKDDSQLYGHLNGSIHICGSFTFANNGTTPIAPCGMMANSFFNDTLEVYRIVEHVPNKKHYLLPLPLLVTDITWTPRYAVKNPPIPRSCRASSDHRLECAFNGSVPPPNWRNRALWELDPDDPDNNGYLNERLQSWLRPSPFDLVRKLYGRVDHELNGPVKNIPNRYSAKHYFSEAIKQGIYLINITYNYPVAGFKGRKKLVLSSTSWLGGKSHFIAFLYIITSGICLILLIIFFIVDRKFGQLSKEVYSFVHNKNNLRQHQRATQLMERASASRSEKAA